MGCGGGKASRPEAETRTTASDTFSETTASTPFAFEDFGASAGAGGPLLGGCGVSSAPSAASAVKEALERAAGALAKNACVPLAPAPSIAFISCDAAMDPEEVRCEFVRAMPMALLHGVTVESCSALDGTGWRAPSVGCLLLEAPPGGFAVAWDDLGDPHSAASWLREQMREPRAIIMGASPALAEQVAQALEIAFPGVPVYGGTAAGDRGAVMSHLGSSDMGISLVGVGACVGFGASQGSDLGEAYVAASSSGGLAPPQAGLVICAGGPRPLEVPDDVTEYGLRQASGDVPLLGLRCPPAGRRQPASVLLFGDVGDVPPDAPPLGLLRDESDDAPPKSLRLGLLRDVVEEEPEEEQPTEEPPSGSGSGSASGSTDPCALGEADAARLPGSAPEPTVDTRQTRPAMGCCGWCTAEVSSAAEDDNRQSAP